MSRALASLVVLVVLVVIAGGPVRAFVPQAERIARATAKTNDASSRDQALQLDLTLRVAGREPIGTGKLITHPTGLARLELRDASGRVERHLRVVSQHTASRNGDEIQEPRAFLPPLSFLQVDSPATLRQALSDYGLDIEAAALAPCGDSLCYVLGDPARVPPPPPPTPEGRAESEVNPEALSEDEEATPEFELETGPVPSVWVDQLTFEIVRIESRSGVVVDFGPVVDFDGVRFPDSITVREPGREPVRFDILAVTPVNAPAAGFSRAWLLAPPPSRSDEGTNRSTVSPAPSPSSSHSPAPAGR